MILLIVAGNEDMHKRLDELNFGQILLLTWELAALEHLKNGCCHFFSVAIDKIHFKFVGNEDIHNISDEFEFRPDRTTDYGVNCP